MNYNNTKLWH